LADKKSDLQLKFPPEDVENLLSACLF